MKKEIFYAILILTIVLTLILNLGLVNASVKIGNLSHEIELVYGASKPITGWVNISLANEPSNSLLTDFNKKITIREFLEKNEADFSCLPVSCEKGYSTKGSELNYISFSLPQKKSKLIGVNLKGEIDEVNGLIFEVLTNAEKSCLNPLKIDVLDDGLYEWFSLEVSNNSFCSIEKPFGCFYKNETKGLAKIDLNTEYCESIKIPPLKGFKIGAIVNGSGYSEFKLLIRLGAEKECNVATNTSGEISCIVELDENLEGFADAEVCLQARNLGDNTYKIAYEDNNPCGYVGSSSHDFEIFVKPLKFESLENFQFNQELIGDVNLGNEISDYINANYNSNCTSGCIVPIRIISGINQNITILNLELQYKSQDLTQLKNKFYEINETLPLLSTDFQELDLEKSGFLSSSSFGEYEFILNLGNTEIFDERIKVRKIIEISEILPHTVPALVPVNLVAVIEGNVSNLTFKWSFENEVLEETTSRNVVKHIFPNVGDYDVNVKVIGSFGESSKTVSIKVVAPKEAIITTIKEYRTAIKNISSRLDKFPPWIKNEIDGSGKFFDLEALSKEINNLEEKNKDAFKDEEYTEIMGKLLNLKVPYKIETTQTINSIKFFQTMNQVDLNLLRKLESEEAEVSEDESLKEKYYNAMNRWLKDNLNALFESKTYSVYYKNGMKEILFSDVKINLAPKEVEDEFYLVIKGDTSKMKFSEDYNEKEIDETAFTIRFDELTSERIIEFLHPEKIEISEPPVFISPPLEKLETGFTPGPCNNNKKCETGENYKNCRSDCKPWKWVLFWFGILFFAAFVVYIILQEWYKRYYESYLFSEKAQLFNLINFMYNATNQGLSKSEAFKRLRSYGWTNEQLTYSWHKFKGERTGMWEIPIFKWLENRQVQREIEKRKGLNMNRGLVPVERKF